MPVSETSPLDAGSVEPRAEGTRIGGILSDIFIGNILANRFLGGFGNDVIAAAWGNDLVIGDDGDDYLSGNQGRDTLVGGAGADTFVLDGDFDQDTIRDFRPEEGDRLEFVTYATHQAGWTGEDILSFATQQADGVLIALPDSDEAVALIGVSLADLRSDMFIVTSLVPDDELITMPVLPYAPLFDRDVVTAAPDGVPTAMSLATHYKGSAGSDSLLGSNLDDIIFGGAGDDRLDGGSGNDYIEGGDGNDRIWGRLGNDTLLGGAGNDRIYTKGDVSYVDGGAGNDTIAVQCEWGGDHLMLGGSGADRFEFVDLDLEAASDLIIADFELGTDSLVFQGINAQENNALLGTFSIADTAEGALLSLGVNDTLLFVGVDAEDFRAFYANLIYI